MNKLFNLLMKYDNVPRKELEKLLSDKQLEQLRKKQNEKIS